MNIKMKVCLITTGKNIKPNTFDYTILEFVYTIITNLFININ